MRTFDFANPNIHAPSRPETTVPQQALFALNDPFVIARAESLARPEHSKTRSAETEALILYRHILAREPSAEDLASAIGFLGETSSDGNLPDFAQALLVSNEFLFVD